jgi:FtsZ-interacting cell division protein ZipA
MDQQTTNTLLIIGAVAVVGLLVVALVRANQPKQSDDLSVDDLIKIYTTYQGLGA